MKYCPEFLIIVSEKRDAPDNGFEVWFEQKMVNTPLFSTTAAWRIHALSSPCSKEHTGTGTCARTAARYTAEKRLEQRLGTLHDVENPFSRG
jgi:hypothetical protein